MSTDEHTEEQPSTASTSGTEDSSPLDPLGDMFIKHKLTKMDTLAGLAVRYNVTVSDIKRANGFLADTAMFARETLLIPTRPLPVGPEYSTWAGMIVTHYGRLGSSSVERDPSDSPYACLPSQTRTMQELRGYYSTGPSRSQSPQYGSAGDDDGDHHHLFASGRRGGGWSSAGQQVELMERSSTSNTPGYIEERLRRRGRGDSQAEELPSSSGVGAGSSGSSFGFFHRQPLFGSSSGGGSSGAPSQRAAALASAGGKQLQHWKETLLHKLKKVASQPALALPAGSGMGIQQLGQAAVASGPLSADRQRAAAPAAERKAD